MILEYIISKNDENLTIKDILKKRLKISNRLLNKLKLNKKIYIDDNVALVNEYGKECSKLSAIIDFEEEDNIIPQKRELEILYEDEYFLAVNKPANTVVHPCSFHLDNTLANYVKHYLGNNKKIRAINRLDNGTSGIVLFAKNEYIQELFKNLEVLPIKEYIAITYRHFSKKEGTISLPISRKPESIIEREVNLVDGQTAITHYKVMEEYDLCNIKVSKLKIILETGRTHQIRVHMNYLGHPLLGDTLYKANELLKENNDEFNSILPERQALHAHKLVFNHPIKNEKIEIIAPIPKDIDILGKRV